MNGIASTIREASHNVGAKGRSACAPSNLHPGGFGVAPVALMLDSRATAIHLAVYVALASCMSGQSASGRPYLNRVAERAHVCFRTVERKLMDLEAWGYIIVRRTNGMRSEILICPTANPFAATPDSGVGGQAATPDSGVAPPCPGSRGTPDSGVMPPQSTLQSSNQTGGSGDSARSGSPPATTTAAGSAPPAPPPEVQALCVELGVQEDPSIVADVWRNSLERGIDTARSRLKASLMYGLRPRAPVAPPPAAERR
jgi:hypothetical protein